MRSGTVFFKEKAAGKVWEDENGFHFQYAPFYLESALAEPISLTLPLQKPSFTSKTMLAFFDGLIPEGWLLDIAHDFWKINPRDRMGLLLACCQDCIGAVSIFPEDE